LHVPPEAFRKIFHSAHGQIAPLERG